jgi:hypothetical protein
LVLPGEAVFWKVFPVYFPEESILSADPFSQRRLSFLIHPTEECPSSRFFPVVRIIKNSKEEESWMKIKKEKSGSSVLV